MKGTRRVREEFIQTQGWNIKVIQLIREHGSIAKGLMAYAKELEAKHQEILAQLEQADLENA